MEIIWKTNFQSDVFGKMLQVEYLASEAKSKTAGS